MLAKYILQTDKMPLMKTFSSSDEATNHGWLVSVGLVDCEVTSKLTSQASRAVEMVRTKAIGDSATDTVTHIATQPTSQKAPRLLARLYSLY